MKTVHSFILVAMMAVGPHLDAQAQDASEFHIAPDLVDKVYARSVDKQLPRRESVGAVGFEVGQLMPQTLEVSSPYFKVAYQDSVTSVPVATIRVVSAPIGRGYASTRAHGSLGYGYTQGVYTVRNDAGIDAKDTLELQWVPVRAGVATETRRPIFGVVSPGIHAAIGADWLVQTGTLDGIAQNAWLPSTSAGPQLTFLPSVDGESTGFSGITLSAAFLSARRAEQRLIGWNWQLGGGLAF